MSLIRAYIHTVHYKCVCRNVRKIQEPIKFLGIRRLNTKQVPYSGPRLAGFVHICIQVIIILFYQSDIRGSCGSTPLTALLMCTFSKIRFP
jgi:hypothetical protein